MAQADLLREWPHQAKSFTRRAVRRTLKATPVMYGLLNIVTASGIVFANKIVFSTYDFRFTIALTLVHTIVTVAGMYVCARLGMFEVKQLPQLRLLPLSCGFVGYIILCNLSLRLNSVGFYQVMKIAVAPTVIIVDALFFRKYPSFLVSASVTLVCIGIGIATVSDSEVTANIVGAATGLAATVVTAIYQTWAGTKQKELKASSMQLLHQYTPQAALLLAILVPMFETVGLVKPTSDSILGYPYTAESVLAILASALLGVLVSLSTFLVIGATSSLTYNVVGHLKTVIILTGSCLIFGEAMPANKFFGVLVAMAGIVWYTHLKLSPKTSVQMGGPTRSEKEDWTSEIATPLIPVASTPLVFSKKL